MVITIYVKLKNVFMNTKRELKNQWMLGPFVMLGILLFSNNLQAQTDSVSYRKTETTTTTNSVDVDVDGQSATTDNDDADDYTRPRAGIKGGLNLSNLIVDDVTDRHGRVGFHVGVYGQLFPSNAFTIQPEINYSTKGNRIVKEYGSIDQETTFNLSYIDIPVLAVFKLGKVAEIHAGPYWAYMVGANVDFDGDLSNTFKQVDRDNFDKWDYGLVGGLSFNVGKAAQLGARYNYGLNEIARSDGAKQLLGNSKNSVAQVYLAFNLAAKD
jgi:hypothetical protein